MFQRRVRRALLVLLSVGAVLAGRSQSAESAATWPEEYFPELKAILATALKQSPQVLLKEIEVAKNEAQRYGADAQRLPSVGGEARYAMVETAVSSNTNTRSRDNGLFYSVSANQALFHWGALKNNSALARLRIALAEKNTVEAARALAVTLRASYLSLIARKASLMHIRFAVQLRRAELELAKEKQAAGTIPASEVGRTELEYAEAKSLLERNQLEFDSERRRFGRLAGIGDIAEAAIPAAIPKPVYSAETTGALLADLLRQNGKSLFEVAIAEMHVREAELNYKIQRVRLLPKFNVGIGYRLENTTNATQTFVTQTGVAQQTAEINMRWALFDGFATKGAKLEALSDKRAWQQQLEQTKDRLLDDAQKLQRTLALDAEDINHADIRRSVAEANLRTAIEENKLGNVPKKAIEAATADVRLAEYRSTLARATFLSNWSAFVSLTGEDPVIHQLPPRYVRQKR